MPFSVREGANHPLSLYAATKKSSEMMVHSYASLFGAGGHRLAVSLLSMDRMGDPIWRCSGLPEIFLRAVPSICITTATTAATLHTSMTRFARVVAVVDRIPRPAPDWDGEADDPSTSRAPFRIYNVGTGQPVDLTRYVAVLEGVPGSQGHNEPAAQATWRYFRHLGRYLRTHCRLRLSAGHFGRRGCEAFRGMVSGFLQDQPLAAAYPGSIEHAGV